MTIIAWRDGIMAADSAIHFNDTQSGTTKKIFYIKVENKPMLIGAAGAHDFITQWLKWYTASLGSEKYPTNTDSVILTVTQEGDDYALHNFERYPTPARIYAPFAALGSGHEIARGAMHMGATAHQAVEAAIELDPWCSGPIETIQFKDK